MEDIKKIAANIFGTAPGKISMQKYYIGDVNYSYIAIFENKKIFVKIENNNRLPVLYSGQIERELAGAKLCAGKNIICPNVLDYDLTGKSPAKKYIVTEFIEQPLLSQVWKTLDHTNKQSIRRQALNIVKTLTEVTSSHFGDIFDGGHIGHFLNWSNAFFGLIQIAISDCDRLGTLNQVESGTILKAAEECTFRLPDTETACFSHMDLHWNNMFVDKLDDTYEITGIIDFGSSLYAPGYSDLFRLQDGFLYGSEKFYNGIDIPFSINKDQKFAADLFNTLDYYVFLSFTGQNIEIVRKRIIEKCNEYLKITQDMGGKQHSIY